MSRYEELKQMLDGTRAYNRLLVQAHYKEELTDAEYEELDRLNFEKWKEDKSYTYTP